MRSAQVLAITTMQDSLWTQANIFFGHFFAEVILLLPTHASLPQPPAKVSIHSLTLIYSKCQDIRSCVVECASHLIM